MGKKLFLLFLGIICFCGCATKNTHVLKVETNPSGALISVHKNFDPSSLIDRSVAGTTPIEKSFNFGKSNEIWIEVEKRGYKPQNYKATPESGNLTITLEKSKDENGNIIPEFSIPKINRILLINPKIKVIERGFSSEKISDEKSSIAQSGIAQGISSIFSGSCEVTLLESPNSEIKYQRSLWRDINPAMDTLDPLRLQYMEKPSILPTRSSKKAARELGKKYNSEVILLVSGKQNRETAGMVVGKACILTLGTVSSYASGYSRAMSNGDSIFAYNIYIPHFSEGTQLQAAIVDCKSGEILWVNKGLWGSVPFENPQAVNNLLTDLLTGFKPN